MFRKTYCDLSRQGKFKRRKHLQKTLSSDNNFSGNSLQPSYKYHEEDNNYSSEEAEIPPDYVGRQDESPSRDEHFFTRELDCSSESDFSQDSDGVEEDEEDEDLLKSQNSCGSFRAKLSDWAVQFQISQVALSALLCILKTHGCLKDLPTDPRTLLKTQRSVATRSVEPGNYAHIGLVAGLQKVWSCLFEQASKIELLIGIDGLPIFKSSSVELWPILGMVFDNKFKQFRVFPIGIYCGKGKPHSSSNFLSDFVEEAKRLISDGFLWMGKSIPFSIKGFILDAPAKSFILNTKGHTGYYSCTKCTQSGKWVSNRMTFPENNAQKRTHEDILNKTDEEFHSSADSILLETIPGVNFISSFPIDYMHLVGLGVVRTLIYVWMFSKPSSGKNCKLSSVMLNSISQRLCHLKSCMPVEFNRKPRSLDEIKRWKATEFRQFL